MSFSDSLCLTVLIVWGNTGYIFCRMPLIEDLTDIFLTIGWELQVLGKKTTKVKYHCHHIISRVLISVVGMLFL